MPLWEYQVVWLRNSLDESGQMKLLNSFGESGWELVSINVETSGRYAYLKRPLTKKV